MSKSEITSLQDDELLALEAIYPAEHVWIVRKDSHLGGNGHSIIFNLPVTLPGPTDVYVASSPAQAKPSISTALSASSLASFSADSPSQPLRLQYLPPLSVSIVLTPRYPLHEAARIERISSSWITSDEQRHWIRRRLLEIWQDVGGEILWTWGEWLREGWAEETLIKGSSNPLKGPKKGSLAFLESISATALAVSEGLNGGSRNDLLASLQAYDHLARQSLFEKDRFPCGICLEAKKGSASVQLGRCGHVFCRECVNDYLTLHLTEGSLNLVLSCPDPLCMSSLTGKTASTVLSESTVLMGAISISQLETLLVASPKLIERLHFLKDKAAAEADPSAIPCPRPDCQTLSPAREEDKGDGRWQAFRECPRCSMCFCAWCRLTWHAPSPCLLSSSNAILAKYDAASDSEKRLMELRYGRKNLLKLKAQFEEDQANRAWLKDRTQSCPHCSSPVEKSIGCNHMTCTRCQTHFCFLCGTRLNPSQPYDHFNTRRSLCFNRLFDGLIQDDGQGEAVDDQGRPAGEGGPAAQAEAREQEQHLLALAAIEAAWGS